MRVMLRVEPTELLSKREEKIHLIRTGKKGVSQLTSPRSVRIRVSVYSVPADERFRNSRGRAGQFEVVALLHDDLLDAVVGRALETRHGTNYYKMTLNGIHFKLINSQLHYLSTVLTGPFVFWSSQLVLI
jgi:hypothetical protein